MNKLLVIDFDILEDFLDNFIQFLSYFCFWNVYLFNELIVLGDQALLLAIQNIGRVDLQISLDTHWQVATVFPIESLSIFPFLFGDSVHENAHLRDSFVVNLSSLKFLDRPVIGLWKLCWNGEDVGVLF